MGKTRDLCLMFCSDFPVLFSFIPLAPLIPLVI